MASLPPNLNIPANPGANPALENPVQKNPPETELTEKQIKREQAKEINNPNLNKAGDSIRRKIRDTFNISEMLLALPLLANSFVLQADNISQEIKKVDKTGAVGYVGNTFESLSSVFKFLIDKFVAGGKTADKIESNRSADLTQNFVKRILHPKITEEFTSLLFNARRILFNFKPNTFTVPSAEHDPLNPDSANIASATTATVYGILANVTRPLVWVSSGFAAITTIPSHLMGSYFTYTGNEEAYKATKYFNRISEIFTPLLSNLSSLLSVSKSYLDSFWGDGLKGVSKFVTRGRYNVGLANMVQGLVGSVTSLPYFMGILGKLRDVVNEKDVNNNYKFSTNMKTLADNILPSLSPLLQKVKPDFNVDDFLVGFEDNIEKRISDSDKTLKTFLESLYNSGPLMKNLFSKIRPSDSIGNIQALADSHTVDANDDTDYTFGLIKKASFFREVFDWLHPIQSMLMLLPNSIIQAQDPYINDNSKRFGRRMDRLFGFNSMLLSLPNYLIYGATTRIPQLLLKACQYRERQHILDKANNEDGITNKDSGHQSYLNTIEWLRKLPLVGTDFLASKLESLAVDENTFSEENKFRSVFEKLDSSARKQEASVKASELVGATRIGFRTILSKGAMKAKDPNRGNSFFFAKRNEDGLTDDEVTRKGFYDSVGNFQNIVGKIPVVGWVASPILEAFRNIYKVDTTRRQNAIGNQVSPQQQKILETLQQANQAQAA